MGRGHHTLPVDLDDPVTHPDASALCDAPSHEAADLRRQVSGQPTVPATPARHLLSPQSWERGINHAEGEVP